MPPSGMTVVCWRRSGGPPAPLRSGEEEEAAKGCEEGPPEEGVGPPEVGVGPAEEGVGPAEEPPPGGAAGDEIDEIVDPPLEPPPEL